MTGGGGRGAKIDHHTHTHRALETSQELYCRSVAVAFHIHGPAYDGVAGANCVELLLHHDRWGGSLPVCRGLHRRCL